ncbi:hypothetical protein MHYP_G00194770 [Metynnis hypsauchen]
MNLRPHASLQTDRHPGLCPCQSVGPVDSAAYVNRILTCRLGQEAILTPLISPEQCWVSTALPFVGI